MSKLIKLLPIIFCCVLGCSHLQEKAKVVWGSSTKALEEARINGERHSFPCTVQMCFDQAVVAVRGVSYDIFINNPTHHVLVVMGVPGSIKTTEVGIFFEVIDDNETLVQVASLSHRARRVVAATVFEHLKEVYHVSELDH